MGSRPRPRGPRGRGPLPGFDRYVAEPAEPALPPRFAGLRSTVVAAGLGVLGGALLALLAA